MDTNDMLDTEPKQNSTEQSIKQRSNVFMKQSL